MKLGVISLSESITDDIVSQADIILPSQYFAMVGSAGRSGEQRLMLAVLLDAINILEGWRGTGSARKRRNFAEAGAWVNNRRAAHPFAFDSICDALEIDADRLRSRLQRLIVRSANSTRSLIPRLRLKESGRRQQITSGRLPRCKRAPRLKPARSGSRPESASLSSTHLSASASLGQAEAQPSISY
jgi:hypothetical protein